MNRERNYENEYTVGEVMIGKGANASACDSFDVGPMKGGDRVFAYIDDAASYEVALPTSKIVEALVEKYPQVAGVYAETIDGKTRRWQIAAYNSEVFRVHIRHFDEGGVSLIFDDCRVFMLAERTSNGLSKFSFWVHSKGVVERYCANRQSGEMGVNLGYIKLPTELEEKIIKSIME